MTSPDRQPTTGRGGTRDGAGGRVQGTELTVGKNVKLEKNHVPLHQADHWVWDLGHRLLQACSPMLPLQLGIGHSGPGEFREGKLKDIGLSGGTDTTYHPHPVLSPSCPMFLLGVVPALKPLPLEDGRLAWPSRSFQEMCHGPHCHPVQPAWAAT